jgi:hypothetical protein
MIDAVEVSSAGKEEVSSSASSYTGRGPQKTCDLFVHATCKLCWISCYPCQCTHSCATAVLLVNVTDEADMPNVPRRPLETMCYAYLRDVINMSQVFHYQSLSNANNTQQTCRRCQRNHQKITRSIHLAVVFAGS